MPLTALVTTLDLSGPAGLRADVTDGVTRCPL